MVLHPYYGLVYSAAQMADGNWVLLRYRMSTWLVLFAAWLAIHGSLHCLAGSPQMVPPLVLGIQLYLHREMSPHLHHDGLLMKLVKIAPLSYHITGQTW